MTLDKDLTLKTADRHVRLELKKNLKKNRNKRWKKRREDMGYYTLNTERLPEMIKT